jgi:hypothetical protein
LLYQHLQRRKNPQESITRIRTSNLVTLGCGKLKRKENKDWLLGAPQARLNPDQFDPQLDPKIERRAAIEYEFG